MPTCCYNIVFLVYFVHQLTSEADGYYAVEVRWLLYSMFIYNRCVNIISVITHSIFSIYFVCNIIYLFVCLFIYLFTKDPKDTSMLMVLTKAGGCDRSNIKKYTYK